MPGSAEVGEKVESADGQTFRGLPKTPDGSLDLDAILGPPAPKESREIIFEDPIHHFPYTEPGSRYSPPLEPLPEPEDLLKLVVRGAASVTHALASTVRHFPEIIHHPHSSENNPQDLKPAA